MFNFLVPRDRFDRRWVRVDTERPQLWRVERNAGRIRGFQLGFRFFGLGLRLIGGGHGGLRVQFRVRIWQACRKSQFGGRGR
jgi:hypothetical protein